MKPLGQVAATAVKQMAEGRTTASSEIALPPRDQPLSVSDFSKLEAAVEKSFDARPVEKSVFKPKLDYEGKPYGETFDVVQTGLELITVGDVDRRLVEAIQRPTIPTHTIYHLSRLAAHMRNTRGETGFQAILEDLAYDLRGVSEWAIVKACEHFRRSGLPFFPSAHDFVDRARLFDRAVRTLPAIAGSAPAERGAM